ncbi:Alpha-L-fucosidase [Bertholletia excelsa]
MNRGMRQRPIIPGGPSGCHFPAIFNFGDSNSDTGCLSAAFGRLPSPYGRTSFGKPSGRFSNGRLIIDFIAEKLGLPYLSAYLDSIGTSFRHGANFAVSGSTIRLAHVSTPIYLGKQISQFEQFKARTLEVHNQAKSSCAKSNLPRPEDFARALYTMDCGQNDLHDVLTRMTEEQVQASIPRMMDDFAVAVENLYQEGARAFWIHNTGPIGCLPFLVINYPAKQSNTDRNGCIKSYNEVAQLFNKQLKDRVYQLRTRFPDAFLTNVDIYSVKYSLINEAKKQGFVDPIQYCCGVDGTQVYGSSCSTPPEYISWDMMHYTEAANRWVGLRILNGSFSDPPLPITQACQWSMHTL